MRQYIADFHDVGMDGYYKIAETEEELNIFWGKDSEFLKRFNSLDLSNVIELACGRGRHIEQYKHKAGHITGIDIVEKNINFCKERFKNEPSIEFIRNNGFDFKDLKSEKYSALFTYDAMVHFEMMDIFSYLKETYRVLKPKGKALFHHSNDDSDYRLSFENGKHSRNFMSQKLFAYLAYRAGFKILDQKIVDFDRQIGFVKDLDCITLLEK